MLKIKNSFLFGTIQKKAEEEKPVQDISVLKMQRSLPVEIEGIQWSVEFAWVCERIIGDFSMKDTDGLIIYSGTVHRREPSILMSKISSEFQGR